MKNPNPMLDPYDHLGVSRDADAATIRRAYRRRAKSTHPDSATGGREEFDKTSKALAILIDPTRRARYDATGDTTDQRLDNTFAELAEIIMSLFDAVCAEEAKYGRDPITIDIAAAMRSLCTKNLSIFRDQRANAERQIEKQRRFLKRFKPRGRDAAAKPKPEATLPPGLIDRLLEGRIAQGKEALRLIDATIAKFERVAAALEEYDFLSEVSSASTTSSATGAGPQMIRINLFDVLTRGS